MPTVTVAGLEDEVTFQYWSTAFTVTAIGLPAVKFNGRRYFACCRSPAPTSAPTRTCSPTVELGTTLIPPCVPEVNPADAAVTDRIAAALRGTSPPAKDVCSGIAGR